MFPAEASELKHKFSASVANPKEWNEKLPNHNIS
jgi:hypothetical protein